MKRDSLVKAIATIFGIGYLPYCPGTWASLVAVGIFLVARTYWTFYLLFSIVSCVLGYMTCTKAEQLFGAKDARAIVIDEFAAFSLLLCFIPQHNAYLIAAFILFRLFDITKPFPIKKIEQFSGAWGIMGDDFAACVYAWCCVWIGHSIAGRLL